MHRDEKKRFIHNNPTVVLQSLRALTLPAPSSLASSLLPRPSSDRDARNEDGYNASTVILRLP